MGPVLAVGQLSAQTQQHTQQQHKPRYTCHILTYSGKTGDVSSRVEVLALLVLEKQRLTSFFLSMINWSTQPVGPLVGCDRGDIQGGSQIDKPHAKKEPLRPSQTPGGSPDLTSTAVFAAVLGTVKHFEKNRQTKLISRHIIWA